jgi:hypothetical protein
MNYHPNKPLGCLKKTTVSSEVDSLVINIF